MMRLGCIGRHLLCERLPLSDSSHDERGEIDTISPNGFISKFCEHMCQRVFPWELLCSPDKIIEQIRDEEDEAPG
jgi:hypothetical protein